MKDVCIMLKNNIFRFTYRDVGLLALCLMFALAVNGAVPFLTAPTLGQALWIAGFGYSFSNESYLTIHATNMGYPNAAPIAFGLSGAYPAGILIGAGLNAIDAYTIVVTCWFVIAFMGAAALARIAGTSRSTSFLMATMWLCLPAVWGHAGYSMTGVGIALMPFYLWALVRILNAPEQDFKRFALSSLFYTAVCVISVFTDGYTFVMFAVAASTCIGTAFLAARTSRMVALRLVPVHIAAFGISYVLYKAYFPYIDSNLAPLDFFRGWGADISYFFIPTCGISWFFDYFGACLERTVYQQYGDASVWKTTYMLPLFAASTLLLIWKRPQGWLIFSCLVFGTFALYMSLGPTVKLFSTKPSDQLFSNPFMTASQGWFETGSGWISENIPGFSSMRASYRWTVLGLLATWLLFASSIAGTVKPKWASTAVCALIIVLLIPVPGNLISARANRERFWILEHGLVSDFAADLKPGERVAFLPYRNDFLVNYLAPRIGIRAFNIGGDKNVEAAKLGWPETLLDQSAQQTAGGLVKMAMRYLARRDGDVVVFPYFDMLETAHKGPADNIYQSGLKPTLEILNKSDLIDVTYKDNYAFARLSNAASNLETNVIIELFTKQACLDTACLRVEALQPNNSATQVGEYMNGAIFSTKRAGFLLYGPYTTMDPGEYRLVIKGSANGTAWSDVTSDSGRNVLTAASLCTQNCVDAKLVEQKFVIHHKVDQLEVRVFVDAGADVRIDGYELTPASNHQR